MFFSLLLELYVLKYFFCTAYELIYFIPVQNYTNTRKIVWQINIIYELFKRHVSMRHTVHVAANMVTHEGNETGAGEWFRELRDMGLDAVIASDPALMVIC